MSDEEMEKSVRRGVDKLVQHGILTEWDEGYSLSQKTIDILHKKNVKYLIEKACEYDEENPELIDFIDPDEQTIIFTTIAIFHEIGIPQDYDMMRALFRFVAIRLDYK